MDGVQAQDQERRRKRPMEPVSHIALGLLGMVITALLFAIGGDAVAYGVIAAMFSTTFFSIGVIAQGVRIGLDRR